MKLRPPQEPEHVRAGGSVIARIIACPGSLTAPNTGTNEAAEKGTVAHIVLEGCLRLGCTAEHGYLNHPINGIKVDRAMCDGVQVGVDWVNDIVTRAREAGHAVHLLLEQRVTWEAFGPPEEMRGSADIIIIIPAMKLLIVADYKNGVDPVDVVGNLQVRYYAAAVLATMPELTKGIERVQLAIIQPNAQPPWEDGPVRSEVIEVGDLIDFAEDAMQAVRAGQKPDAPRAPGSHCKYCGHKATCVVRGEHAVNEAQAEFAIATDGRAEVATIPLNELAQKARLADALIERMSAWLKDAKARIETELNQGNPVPGFKLVPKRATRVWNDPKALEAWATLDAGLEPAAIYETPALKSPAQVEALVGKKNLPKHLYSSVSSGYNLASADSSKPAVVLPSAGDEFQAIQA